MTRRTAKRSAALVLAVFAAAGAAWWASRPPAPALPEVDASRADPAVASAVSIALDAAKRNPRDAATVGELGMVLRANDFDRESMQAFAAAEWLDPSDWRWPYLHGLTLVLFEPDRGADCLKRAAERAPAERAEARLRYAEVLFERGELDAADRLTASSTEPRAALLSARIAAERNDWPAVLARSDRARDAAPRRVALLRAEAFARLNRATEADDEHRRASELSDDPAWSDRLVEDVLTRAAGRSNRLRAAEDLLAAGRYGDAAIALERLVRDDPAASLARLRLGQALVRMNDPRAAVRVLADLVAREPGSVEGHFQLGVAYFLTGDTTAALAAFDRAIELKPDHLLAHFNRGHCLRKRGDPRAAVVAFEAALRCKPDHRPAQDAIRAIQAEGK
jgi:tetratricopeptide (TPR) repeat protein